MSPYVGKLEESLALRNITANASKIMALDNLSAAGWYWK
jgi:hypothetical protein